MGERYFEFVVQNLPLTNYAYFRGVTAGTRLSAKQLIDIARYYATYNLYIESWGSQDIARPAFTYDIPQDCSFMALFPRCEEYIRKSYTEVILCSNTSFESQAVVVANSAADAVKKLRANPQISFFQIKDVFVPAYKLMHCDGAYNTQNVREALVCAAVRYRAALPIANYDITVSKTLVERVARECAMQQYDAFSWILACLGVAGPNEYEIGVTINPKRELAQRAQALCSGKLDSYTILAESAEIAPGRLKYVDSVIQVPMKGKNYEILAPKCK